MGKRIKYYTIRIEPWQKGNNQAMWYSNKDGQEYKTQLEVIENGNNKMVPVFKCIHSPFWHIYPAHCTIVKEETVEI